MAEAERAITYRGVVRNEQCDHMGHMNVMWYVGKFDEGTWNLFASLGLTRSRMQKENRGVVAVEQHIEYKRELRAGDTLTVRTKMVEAKGKVVRFTHEMTNDATGEIAAITHLVGVYFDTVARKSDVLPADFCERAARMIADAQNPK
jgi:acyl-CoA thioester hydrolase